MCRGKLSDYIEGIVVKRLSGVVFSKTRLHTSKILIGKKIDIIERTDVCGRQGIAERACGIGVIKNNRRNNLHFCA